MGRPRRARGGAPPGARRECRHPWFPAAPFVCPKRSVLFGQIALPLRRSCHGSPLPPAPSRRSSAACGAARPARSSPRRRDAAMLAMQRPCCEATREVVAPLLEAAAREALAEPPAGGGNRGRWIEYELDVRAESPNLLFHYPSGAADGFEYVRRVVKLELGSLLDQQPVVRRPVARWIAEQFPAVFADWRCEGDRARARPLLLGEGADPPFRAPSACRAADPRPLRRPLRRRRALGRSSRGCRRAHEWRAVRTRSRVEEPGVRPPVGALRPRPARHVPPAARARARRSAGTDYDGMRPMFLREPPPFSAVLERLAQAEATISAV